MLKGAISFLADVANSAEKKAKQVSVSISSNDNMKEVLEDRGYNTNKLETVDGEIIGYSEIGTMYVQEEDVLIASKDKGSRDELRARVEPEVDDRSEEVEEIDAD
ncbi:MAG: hypothetical protein ABEJ98_02100 [Candidatus Nanohaloarchaea archaeon]